MNTPAEIDAARQAPVVKSNALINALTDMTLQEMRFLAFAVSRLDRDLVPAEGQPVDMEIDVVSLAEAFEMDPKSAYREVEIIGDRLQRKIVKFMVGKDRVKVGIITRQKYRDGEGRVWFKFDEDLVPHLLGLRDQFTKYRIKDVYRFQRPSTWRVYELLAQYKTIGRRDFDLDEFRRLVGVAGLYPQVGDLKKRVIVPALEEISTYSDIQVQWEQVKRGRRIVGLRFHIAPNTKTSTPREKVKAALSKAFDKGQSLAPELARILRETYRLNSTQARHLANLAAGDGEAKIQALLPKLRKRWEALPDKDPKTGKARVSLGGYVYRALLAELAPQAKLPTE